MNKSVISSVKSTIEDKLNDIQVKFDSFRPIECDLLRNKIEMNRETLNEPNEMTINHLGTLSSCVESGYEYMKHVVISSENVKNELKI